MIPFISFDIKQLNLMLEGDVGEVASGWNTLVTTV